MPLFLAKKDSFLLLQGILRDTKKIKNFFLGFGLTQLKGTLREKKKMLVVEMAGQHQQSNFCLFLPAHQSKLLLISICIIFSICEMKAVIFPKLSRIFKGGL